MSLDVLGIIPARGGSKGIPKKNLQLLGNKPLIAWTIQTALQSKTLTRIVVSTDDLEIAKVARSYPIEVQMRPVELAQDHVPNIPDVLAYIINQYRASNYIPHLTTMLEPTYPFRTADTIDRVVNEMASRTDVNWVATMAQSKEHPYRCRCLQDNRFLPLLNNPDISNQRQNLPPSYCYKGAVTCTNAFYAYDSFTPTTPFGGIIISNQEAIDIDEWDDLYYARYIATQQYSEVCS